MLLLSQDKTERMKDSFVVKSKRGAFANQVLESACLL